MSAELAVVRICLHCRAQFSGRRWQVYCSPSCNEEARLKRKEDRQRRMRDRADRLSKVAAPKIGNPRPDVQHYSDPEAAAQARRLRCRHYFGCLCFAESKRWAGFHCRDCTEYAEEAKQTLTRRSD